MRTAPNGATCSRQQRPPCRTENLAKKLMKTNTGHREHQHEMALLLAAPFSPFRSSEFIGLPARDINRIMPSTADISNTV